MSSDQTRKDAEMPGAWICDKCKCILQNNILHAGDGSMSADTSPLNEICPNDGQLMRPFTWREANKGFYEDNVRLRAENTKLREKLEGQRTGFGLSGNGPNPMGN